MRKIRFKDYLIDYLEFNNITNKDFANRIGVTPKHLIDILSGNRELSSQIIENISLVTDIPVDYIQKIELNYKQEEDVEEFLKREKLSETQFLNKFNYKYLVEDSYIDFIDSSDKLEIIKDIKKFLRISTLDKIYEIDKEAFYKSKNDKPELLLLWLEKCYRKTLEQEVKQYNKDNINIIVNSINEYAKKNEFNEKKLIKLFNDNGIYLVIQKDIPGSKIRGAFRVHRGMPAIYLTYKHKRIADIYFALLHELAHCKRDFNKAQATSLVSIDGESDDSEVIADNQAFDWMVNNEYYSNTYSIKYNVALEKIYPKCFVVYRLAHDKKISYNSEIYNKYNRLLN